MNKIPRQSYEAREVAPDDPRAVSIEDLDTVFKLDAIVTSPDSPISFTVADDEDLHGISGDIPKPDSFKNHVSDAWFIEYRVHVGDQEDSMLFMLGYCMDGYPCSTSAIAKYDPENEIVLTQSGSRYKIKGRSQNEEPDMTQVMHICARWWLQNPRGAELARMPYSYF